MASRAFEIWVLTAPVEKLMKVRNEYVLHMTERKLLDKAIHPWLTENLDLINERLRQAALRAPEGLDPVRSPEGPDV